VGKKVGRKKKEGRREGIGGDSINMDLLWINSGRAHEISCEERRRR